VFVTVADVIVKALGRFVPRDDREMRDSRPEMLADNGEGGSQ
jgi:hypothetical protein